VYGTDKIGGTRDVHERDMVSAWRVDNNMVYRFPLNHVLLVYLLDCHLFFLFSSSRCFPFLGRCCFHFLGFKVLVVSSWMR
jgi:hypothetical protein